MTNPIANIQRSLTDFKQMDKADKKRYITDLVLNNALYILLFVPYSL